MANLSNKDVILKLKSVKTFPLEIISVLNDYNYVYN